MPIKNLLNIITQLIVIYFTSCLMSCERKNDRVVDQPNVLIILADDLGYSDLSCMGSKYYETPNIDEITSQAMLFTNGYAGCQVCSPSRATLLTGQFTARHGITDWIGAFSGEKWREKNRHSKLLPAPYKHHLDTNLITLPEAFKVNGYSTFFAGKWHLGGEGSLPENHGFDINIAGIDKGSPPGGFFSPFRNPKLKDQQLGENLSMRLAEETSAFIKTSKEKPFFAYLSFYAVHAPLQTTKDKWKKYRNKAELMGVTEQGFKEGHFLPMRLHQDNPVYAGLIESMDDAVGQVLSTLKETGKDKNTIVIFTSDNGGVTSGDHYSTTCMPLKGGKGYEWEGGIRVPLIVNVPWLTNKTERDHTPVMSSDLFPTLLELAGLKQLPEAHIDGKSFVPVLKGKSTKDRPLIWHYPHYGNQGGRPSSIIRMGKWKLIHFWEDNHRELYNLDIDLHEDKDLAGDFPDKASELSGILFDWLKQVKAEIPVLDPQYDRDAEQKAIAQKMKSAKMRLEKQRRDMLRENWEPNSNWWGSQTTND